MPTHGPFRGLLIVGGSLSVALAVVGMVVPVLPTTPFLLLAAFCFSRSSARFHRWLLTNRWFGAYLDNYRSGRGISRQEKAVTIAVLWVTLAATGLTVATAWWSRLLLLAVAVGVTAHLVRIKTLRADATKERAGAVIDTGGAGRRAAR